MAFTAIFKEDAEGNGYCIRCGERLKGKRVVWLNLNCVSGKYSVEPVANEAEDQGAFAFGSGCAKRTLAEQAEGDK